MKALREQAFNMGLDSKRDFRILKRKYKRAPGVLVKSAVIKERKRKYRPFLKGNPHDIRHARPVRAIGKFFADLPEILQLLAKQLAHAANRLSRPQLLAEFAYLRREAYLNAIMTAHLDGKAA